jgi:hypothetical protein
VDATVATKPPEPSQANPMVVFFVTAFTFRQWVAMTNILESTSVLLIMYGYRHEHLSYHRLS